MAQYRFETTWGTRTEGERTRFRLWAPGAPKIELAVGGPDGRPQRFLPMEKDDGGWWAVETSEVAIGAGYGFRIDGGLVAPDPAARAQIGDVHSLSKLVDPTAYHWKTADWRGRPWEECVFYELHTGTFTPDGTFAGVAEKLDHLKDIGVTAIEILPVAQFAGQRGWGYDGVLLYCPHSAYGGVNGLKALVDAAHARGLMVFLDVVYNHFGPDGNYLGAYAPEFFHEEIHTPWGAAIAYDEEPVRRFMIENALYWLEEYRLDGLRLDAIDSIKDTTDTPLVKELAAKVCETFPDRHVHLTTEDDRNIVWHIERDAEMRPKLVSGEWNDDFHHTAHVIATHEHEGYYSDYSHKSVEQMAKALATGFVFQGDYSEHREKEVGTSSRHLPPSAFVNFLQNHDQIGNRAFGERLTLLAAQRHVEALQVILLLSPQVPLMFMGEEWGDVRPFCFFTDFHGDLANAVREGRRSEFQKFAAFQDEEARELIPDPNAPVTFESSSLDWSILGQPTHARRLAQVKELLEKRQEVVVPLTKGAPGDCGRFCVSENLLAFAVAWTLQEGEVLHLFANFSDDPWSLPAEALAGRQDLRLVHAYPRDAYETIEKEGVLPGASVVVALSPKPMIGA